MLCEGQDTDITEEKAIQKAFEYDYSYVCPIKYTLFEENQDKLPVKKEDRNEMNRSNENDKLTEVEVPKFSEKLTVF